MSNKLTSLLAEITVKQAHFRSCHIQLIKKHMLIVTVALKHGFCLNACLI